MLTKIALSAALIAVSISTVNAETITHGHITTDTQYDILADTVKGREYLRLDTFNMTYQETLASVEEGGMYYGWSIADSYISDDLINALLGGASSACVDNEFEKYGNTCGSLTNWQDGDLGASYSSTYDYWAYISSKITNSHNENKIGLTEVSSTKGIVDYDDWSSESNLDSYGSTNAEKINLLLYRENTHHKGGYNHYAVTNNLVSTVPLTSTGILLSALIGFVGFRRKK